MKSLIKTKLILLSSLCAISLFILFFTTSKIVTLDIGSFSPQATNSNPTNVNHLVFGIASSGNSWPKRQKYAKLWWNKKFKGCVFVDNLPHEENDNNINVPPLCVSEDTSNFNYTYRHGGLRSAIRVARVVKETVELNHSNVRWYVFGDDDTIFFPENLVKTLSKYDHRLWYYVGAYSENYEGSQSFGFGMAFGGGGFVLSASLANVLSKVFDSCIERYSHLYGSDARVFSCISELGVGLTYEPGFHQINMDSPAEDETSGSTPQPQVSNMGPPKRKNRSQAWNHFTPDTGSSKSAKCNYCGGFIKYSGGTSAMIAHTARCKDNPNNVVNTTLHGSTSTSMETTINSSPQVPKFDQEASRLDLVNMFVALELPFQKVEHPFFHKFVYGLEPRFGFPSRTTLTREILKNWEGEKAKMKSILSQHCRRVCLTTDTWTSTQNYNYMCLTGHYIDNNWKLQKKILSFVQVEGHTGEIMAKTVKNCLNDWELSRVLSVTVDNATSNDVGIQHLKRWLMSQNGLVLNGEYLHTRCCAHILNLIVKDGLAEVDNSILRVRAAVRYVRRTPSRFGRFKKCIDHETIGYKGYVGNDCETRWNSTYKMLKAALIHKMTFMELEFNDQIYVDELNSNKGVPTLEDWERVELILPFLSIFHEATMRMSGSSYLTSNLYMLEVFSVGRKIINMCNSEDAKLKSMALKMKMKYDKYWGNPDRLNMLLLIAMVLDPQSKMKLVVWLTTRIYGSAQAESLETKLDAYLKSMYDEYSGRVVSRLGSSSNLASALNGYGDPHQIAEFYESEQCSTSESEIAKYNRLDVEERRPDFDVLEWWKVNSSRFPILASIARDVLAIPITTVASESTFSTGGRILDPYRSSLSVATVEALICTQDWLGAAFPSFITDEDLDTIDQIEEEMFYTQDATSCSTSVALGDN